MKRIMFTALFVSLLTAGCAFGGDMLDEAAAFPKFNLKSHTGELVDSNDLLGSSYLVYFYPKADTPG